MKFKNDQVIFESTGRREYCSGEGLSCHPASPETLYYGADGGLPGFGDPLTGPERREAYESMIAQCKAWLEAGETS